MDKRKKILPIRSLKLLGFTFVLLGLFLSFNACKSKAKMQTKNENTQKYNIKDVKEISENDKEISSKFIERMPVYPGCKEKTNQEIGNCFNKNISRFVSKNFNTEIASTLGLTGVIKITSHFTIDTTGEIINIKANSKYPELAKELERVLAMLPKMKKPGMHNHKPVRVTYTFPISFKID